MVKDNDFFSRVGGPSGKRWVDPTGEGFDMPHYLNWLESKKLT